MNMISLISAEFQKIRRSKILPLLITATVILWIPSILNAGFNFNMQAEGISPENSFFIQGFMGMAWFMFPAVMVVLTVLMMQTERTDHGMLRMLALPVSKAHLCLAKFVVLAAYSVVSVLLSVGMYYISAAAASRAQSYDFILPPLFVMREAAAMWASSIPMLAFFWMLAVCIQKPVFSIGIGLSSIVPSVLIISTRIWFAYPMSYPLFVLTARYGQLAANLTTSGVNTGSVPLAPFLHGNLLPWLPVAAAITAACLTVACLRFGRAERR